MHHCQMAETRHKIAAILPLEMEYSGRLLEGALTYARAHRRVTLGDVAYQVDDPNGLQLKEPFAFDAAMIWATREAAWVERLLAAEVPMISASGDWPRDLIPCVAFDNQSVVAAAVDHLAEARPAALLHLEFQMTGLPLKESRARLFGEAAARHGIPASSGEVFRAGDEGSQELVRRQPLQGRAANRMRAVLRKLPRPAAVWCGDDILARRVCELADAMGLKVPEDLAVLGFGDFRSAECGNPRLSSIPLPGSQIGYHAFALLDGMLAGEATPPPFSAVAPPPVVVRESTSTAVSGDPLDQARAFIAAHAHEGVTVKEVASVAGLSPQSLHARFLKRFGRSPGEEIRGVRLAAAKHHLQDPRLSISRIAGLCGFNQQSKFSNFFRRETGVSPRAWRESHT
jgi:DNA-binding LacI/PurR family transcriptional regulator